MVMVLTKRTMLTGDSFVLLIRVVFCLGSPAVLVFSFLSFSPSPFGPIGSLWGGAVVVRGHPRVCYRYMDLGVQRMLRPCCWEALPTAASFLCVSFLRVSFSCVCLFLVCLSLLSLCGLLQ